MNDDDTLEEWASSLEFIRQSSEIDVFEIHEVVSGQRVKLTFRDETQPYGWPEIDA